MKEKQKCLKNSKGITLIALVVTIIVLIILAGITINLILGENGIITKASQARQVQEIAEIKEKIKLDIATKEAEKIENTDGITQDEIEEILGKYGTVNKNDDETIKSLTPKDKDYEIPYEELYEGEISSEPEVAKQAFDRAYGVIEVEFLEGTGYTTTTTPNAPNMGSNMKKVYWEDDGTEVVEGDEGFDETKWYNYIAQTRDTTAGGTSKWANAVTVDDDENITGYFVWIPRYAYRIVYFDTQAHEDAYRLTGATEGIIGYSDSRGLVHPNGATPSDMGEPVTSISVGVNKLRPHPVFEDGSQSGYTQGEWNTALEGIWIAKYETSGTTDALKSVPGVEALTNIGITEIYTYALNYDTENNSHMLKNSEWGAMAYLADSKYGRNGTTVSENADSGMYTAGAEGATVVSNPLQSTTGNYYGIYDVVGGAYEYVATNIEGVSNSQYSMVYEYIEPEGERSTEAESYVEIVNKKFGDAIVETSTAGTGSTAWNSEYSNYIGYGYVYYGSGIDGFAEIIWLRIGNNGLFSFESEGWNSRYSNGFRLCMCVE